jgi:hypothetical protein
MSELRRLVSDWHCTADQLDAAAMRRKGAADHLALEDWSRLQGIAVAYRSCAAELERVVVLAAEVA